MAIWGTGLVIAGCKGLKEANQEVKVLTTNAGLDEFPLEQLNKTNPIRWS